MKDVINPVMISLTLVESDESTLADVPEAMNILQNLRMHLSAEEDSIMDKAFDRFDEERFVSDAHFLANILHPQYRGKGLNADDRLRG